MNKRRIGRVLFSFTLVLLLLICTSGIVHAQDGDGGEDSGVGLALDQIGTLVADISTAVVRFLLIIGIGVFILAVVRGGFDGVLGSVIGNQMTAGAGLYRALAAVVALLVMLFGVSFAGTFVSWVAGEIDIQAAAQGLPASISVIQDAPSGASDPSSAELDLDQALQLTLVQDMVSDAVFKIIRFLLGIGVAVFMVAVVRGGLDAQLGNLIGNQMAVSRGYQRILGAAGAVLFLLLSLPLARALVDTLVPQFITHLAVPTLF
jgi:hypothetical protein